jgi:crossover junction endodeoxyribonuclease RuvC
VRVIGIDCGSQCTGYGVIDSDGRRHQFVRAGVIRTSAKELFSARLRTIHSRLKEIIAEEQPDAVAVEGIFAGANVRTALQLAHVRGVAMLAAAEAGLLVGEYSPLEVKGSVVGYGRATKEQVQMMVTSLLRLEEKPKSFDASDALAVAICHSVRSATAAKLAPPRQRAAKGASR